MQKLSTSILISVNILNDINLSNESIKIHMTYNNNCIIEKLFIKESKIATFVYVFGIRCNQTHQETCEYSGIRVAFFLFDYFNQ